MSYDLRISSAPYMVTSSGFDYQPKREKSVEELKKDAMAALLAWQGKLKAEKDEESTLNELLADLASKIASTKESDEIDAAIRKEWLERQKPK